jgi:hypothetical protein
MFLVDLVKASDQTSVHLKLPKLYISHLCEARNYREIFAVKQQRKLVHLSRRLSRGLRQRNIRPFRGERKQKHQMLILALKGKVRVCQSPLPSDSAAYFDSGLGARQTI